MSAGAYTWPTVREIPRARFDAFVGYCRMPGAVHHTLDEDGHLSSLYPARHIAKAQTIVIQKG